MKHHFHRLKPFMLCVLCAMGLCSCLWTQVNTHTLVDAVGKKEYIDCDFEDLKKAPIYRKDGVYYVQHTFYKVPARGEVGSRLIFDKHPRVEHLYLSSYPKYQEGMETVHLYRALGPYELQRLLPKARYKEEKKDEWVLSHKYFEGKQPVTVFTAQENLRELHQLSNAHIPEERSTLNYMVMPLTGALYAVDIPLTVACTTAGWLTNITLFVTGIPTAYLIEAVYPDQQKDDEPEDSDKVDKKN